MDQVQQSDNTVFGDGPSPKDSGVAPGTNDNASLDDSNVLSELVGENKKFKSVADLAKGKKEADLFIEQLKREKEELHKELLTRLSVEEALGKIVPSSLAVTKPVPPITPTEKPSDTKAEEPSPGNRAELQKLVESTVSSLEQRKISEANVLKVNDALKNHFGSFEKAQEFIGQKASELGLGKEFLKEAARRSPQGFFSLIGFNEEAAKVALSNPSVQQGSINTTSLLNTQSATSVKSKYDKMRKESPAKYYSAKVQNEIFQLAKEGKYV